MGGEWFGSFRSDYDGYRARLRSEYPNGFIVGRNWIKFFMVKNSALYAPKCRNILMVISLHYLLELEEQLDIPGHECNIEPFDLYESDEAFLTATPFCVLPTTHLNGLLIGEGGIGAITKKKTIGSVIRECLTEYRATNPSLPARTRKLAAK